MSRAALDRKSDAVEAQRAKWSALALPRAAGLLDDARAHAGRAVTDALKRTRDGRATIARANRSPSYRAALARLDELLAYLAGPSTASLQGALRDAREACYRAAWYEHARTLAETAPEVLRAGADAPSRAKIDEVRGAVLHGYDLRRMVQGPIAVAARQLSAAVAQAGMREATDEDAAGVLDLWRHRAGAALAATLLTALADGAEYADRLAGMDLVRPDLLDDATGG